MSGLAGLLAGLIVSESEAGIYRWHGAFDVADVRRTVEHAGFGFAHVDGWLTQTKAEFLAAVGEALDLPDDYGQNFDALGDCLHDIGARQAGVVLLWDGWSTLARADESAFNIALTVLGSRVNADRGVPFSVLLRGDGPEVPGIGSLD
jgi:RNAse (barnase) inhibitor barstar